MKRWLLSLLCLLPLLARAAPADAVALFVLTGDQHSAYERTAQVVAAVDRLKAENPGLPLAVLLDGDTLEYGNAVARRSAGAVDFAMFAALARRAPLVINLGNHEPEFYDLAGTVTRLEATGARVVTNLADHSTGQPAAPASVRLALGGVEAVVVGVATDNLSTYRVAVRPELQPAEPLAWAKENFPKLLGVEHVASNALEEKRVEGNALHLNIVLSHAGLKADRALLPLVPDGTLFAGAHDHLRFVQPFGRTVYVHSGSWNAFLTLAWLRRGPDGAVTWGIDQIPLADSDPADPELAALIRETREKHLTPEDRAVVAHTAQAFAPAKAARAVAGALRRAAGVDAAFIGNTTFGAGLPAGAVTRAEFDGCVRFDGPIFTATVGGARLKQLLAAANQGPDTPFERRGGGEFSYADGPTEIDDTKTYRIATTDWGAKNTARYFGEPAIDWVPAQPELKLKAAAVAELR